MLGLSKLSTLLVLLPLLSAPVSHAQSRPQQYDYIVIGAGAAGSVVASRLSEDPRVSVLLIEGGPTNEGVTNSIVPYLYPRTYNSQYNWNFTTVPQQHLNGRSTAYLRGHILGGSTSINGMALTRGPSSDWDKIASYTRDRSFSWNRILPLIRRNEAFDSPPAEERWANAYDPTAHGFNGDVGVALYEEDSWINEPMFAAAQEAGIAHSRDTNGGNPLGISWLQTTVKNGARSSAATAFLGPSVRRRRNLSILLNSKVTRVIPERRAGRGPLHFTTVEYTDERGRLVTAVTNREIILSAGVLATPTILMRSGLGPRATLRAANITTLLDIPAVGQHLQDRPGVPMVWRVNSTDTDDPIDRNATYLNELIAGWNRTRTGRLTQSGYRHIIFDRVPSDSPILQTTEDPSSGETCPHYEIYPANKWTATTPLPATGNFVSLASFVSSSNVHGTVSINPANPNGNPVIDPKYLESEWDRFVLRTAVRKSVEFMSTPAWKKWDATPVFDPSILESDEALDQYIAANCWGALHGVGTARMGPANSPPGTDVVGPDFKVKGVRGLRVVDTSVFPFVFNGHTMGPTYIMAEKAADLIRSGH